MIDTAFLCLLAATIAAQSNPTGMQAKLAAEDPAALAKAAKAEGDPARGALVFHAPQMLCARCHANGEQSASLGPDLSRIGKETTDAHLIESILAPSKVIKKEYEPVTILTKSGKTVSGLLVSDRPEGVTLRTANLDEPPVTIPAGEIDERKVGGPSFMPVGLVEGLTSRQQFLDLLRYLREIADKGPTRALELRPAPSLLAVPLPEYEKTLDHAGLLSSLGPANLRSGELIYRRVCANCHGTKDQAGSMPTSLRFASGMFKNGNDPLSMYRTITHGFNQMPPQTWMVPRQKYDVIHYIRETFLKPSNPSQFTPIDPDYLARLPKGSDRGPEPTNIEPWLTMDYGPSMMATVEAGNDAKNIAYKGISVRLDAGPGGVSRGRDWVVYDHDTMRVAAAWTGRGFLDWQGINFDGQHGMHPHVAGAVAFSNATGPGWADPETGSWADPRLRGRDGRPYGPLPRAWAKYQGLYRHGDRSILAYRIGDADILEMPGLELDSARNAEVFTRTLEIGKSSRDLTMKVAETPVAVAVPGNDAVEVRRDSSTTTLRIPASATPTTIKVLIAREPSDALASFAKTSPAPTPLRPLTHGGPGRWPEVLTTQSVRGGGDGPFAVDVLTHPASNPWNSRMRLAGFDFFADGRRAAVCDWDGDVWLVDGLNDPSGALTWRRIAAGLFQPLGLKIVDEQIYVGCRDQIAILRDLNGDGETDYYECFNDDHQVTEHFHEFAMGLQTDARGNFYYAKAARHGKTALVPQHGTLLKVSKDGSKTEILATGFRAPNGVCLNPDGTFFVTDQEGFWNPKNRINLVKPGVRFYGNMWGYHDVTDTSDAAMEPPVCWITNAMDRSPAEMLHVPADAWGPLGGSLLNLSYGYGKIYVVPTEVVDGVMQGGVSPLPIPQLPTGIMRGRFHPAEKQLYACGLFAWAGNQEQPGGFYRIRYTGKPVHAPIGLHARSGELAIEFSGRLDPKSIEDLSHVGVKTWSIKRSERYGSDHHDEAPSTIRGVRLSDDGKTLVVSIPDLKPTMCMEIRYNLRGSGGEPVDGVIHNTIHRVRNP